MTIEALHTGDGWSPQQALAAALSGADEMECVVIAYIIKDSDGETRLRCSDTDSRNLLWLGNAIQCYAMET